MTDYPLLTKKIVDKNRALKTNQKQYRKTEKRKLFDFSTKIYRVVTLRTEDLLDLTESASEPSPLPETVEEILTNIRNAKVTGMSGSGFPAIKKIEALLHSEANHKYLIINGIQSDPALLHDDWLLTHRWEDICQGMEALRRCFSFEKILIATRSRVQVSDAQIPELSIENCNYFYPLGEEHILIQKLLGRGPEQNAIPATQGILVFNVQTILMLGMAAAAGREIEYRYLTVANLSDGSARIAKVPIGTFAEDVLLRSFPWPKHTEKYIGDGAMSCHPIEKNETIGMGTNAVIYAQPVTFTASTSCLGCGTCQKKCPSHLPVAGMIKALKYGQAVPREASDQCIQCHACTYFCSAGIYTSSYMR